MVNSVSSNNQVQRLVGVEAAFDAPTPKATAALSLKDVFEPSSKAPGVKRPTTNVIDEGYWLAHFLLDQQKRANVKIALKNQEISQFLNQDKGEMSKALSLDKGLKQDLQNIERLKGWKRKTQSPNLENNEQFLMCLLKLFTDRENVQPLDWLDVSIDNFADYTQKIAEAVHENQENVKKLKGSQEFAQKTQKSLTAAKDDKTKRALALQLKQADLETQRFERLAQLGELKVTLMGKKARVLEHYVMVGRKGKEPLREIQEIMSNQVAPMLHDKKEWTLFGQQCIDLATDLTNLINQHQNTRDKDEKEEIEGFIKQSIEQIDAALAKEKHLVTAALPGPKDLQSLQLSTPKRQ